MNPRKAPCIGLALGSGSARGWAHIGVIRALEQAGIRPSVVAGTSIGALVGAAYAAGLLDRFEEWVRGMGLTDVLGFMDLGLGGGLLKGDRLMAYMRQAFADRPIEALPVTFGAVATALHSGAEVWLRSGSTLDAVRASIAMPGLFAPIARDDVVLVDGGLVNPVPVSLARAMGAEVVIAVDLSSDILGRHLAVDAPARAEEQLPEWLRKLQGGLGFLHRSGDGPPTPSLLDVLTSSLNIMQVRISRSRMAGDPPEVVVAPRLAHLGLLDFHRAEEAIRVGMSATGAIAETLRLLEMLPDRSSESTTAIHIDPLPKGT